MKFWLLVTLQVACLLVLFFVGPLLLELAMHYPTRELAQ